MNICLDAPGEAKRLMSQAVHSVVADPSSACWACIALVCILHVRLSAERCLIGFPMTLQVSWHFWKAAQYRQKCNLGSLHIIKSLLS